MHPLRHSRVLVDSPGSEIYNLPIMIKMRIWLMLCLVFAAALVPASAWQKTPTIVFETLTKDFGDIPLGDEVKFVFKFTNKGQGTLEIRSVEPG